MRNDIINYLEKEIRSRCESENNFFGEGIFYHIKAVAENAAYLADKYGADKEIAVIAAWLHDIASITDYSLYEEHHIHGAEMAEEILNGFDYDKDKIQLVKKCILNHRGSKPAEKQSAEEVSIADADAISHFDSVPSLFYLAYVKRGLGIREGIDFVKNKLERSYKKLSHSGKEIFAEKYKAAMAVIG